MAREIFDKIDVDGSGSITADELALLARRYVGPLRLAADVVAPTGSWSAFEFTRCDCFMFGMMQGRQAN